MLQTSRSIPMPPYYEPQERRTQQLTARIPKSISDGLKDLARLWTHMERTRTGDADAEVTVSDVVVRLLQVGLDGAWAEIGFQPKTDEQWQKLLERADKAIESSFKATKKQQ
jgi:hypothetical protein